MCAGWLVSWRIMPAMLRATWRPITADGIPVRGGAGEITVPLGLLRGGGAGLRRGERDPDPDPVDVPGGLVGLRPVLRAPLVLLFRRVVGVDLQEAAGGEQVRGDVGPGPVIGLQVRAPERGTW